MVVVGRCGRCYEAYHCCRVWSLLPDVAVVARSCVSWLLPGLPVVDRWPVLPGGCCCEVYHCHQLYSLCRERVDVHDLHGAEQDKAIDDVEVFASKQQQSL